MSGGKMRVVVDDTATYDAANAAFRAFHVPPHTYRPLRIKLRKYKRIVFYDRHNRPHTMARVFKDAKLRP